eukprot:COSAG01_NODE_25347_length_748_cov_0.725732_2_plen_159_part_01
MPKQAGILIITLKTNLAEVSLLSEKGRALTSESVKICATEKEQASKFLYELRSSLQSLQKKARQIQLSGLVIMGTGQHSLFWDADTAELLTPLYAHVEMGDRACRSFQQGQLGEEIYNKTGCLLRRDAMAMMCQGLKQQYASQLAGKSVMVGGLETWLL